MIPVIDPLTGMVTLQERPETTTRGSRGFSRLYATTGLSTPATGTDGELFYDTDDGILYVFANGIWNAISGGGAPSTAGQAIGLLLALTKAA